MKLFSMACLIFAAALPVSAGININKMSAKLSEIQRQMVGSYSEAAIKCQELKSKVVFGRELDLSENDAKRLSVFLTEIVDQECRAIFQMLATAEYTFSTQYMQVLIGEGITSNIGNKMFEDHLANVRSLKQVFERDFEKSLQTFLTSVESIKLKKEVSGALAEREVVSWYIKEQLEKMRIIVATTIIDIIVD